MSVKSIYDTVETKASQKKAPWYQWEHFPLVPIFWHRPKDKMNEADFQISWLNVRVWSMMSLGLEVGVDLSGRGLLVFGQLAYLRINIWLLMFPYSWHQKFWRVPKTRD